MILECSIRNFRSIFEKQTFSMLASSSRSKIENTMEIFCGEQQLKDTEELFNTNSCENLHSRVFSVAPKSTVWSRNFPGLCHAVTLGASIGKGESLLRLAQFVGLQICSTDPIFRYNASEFYEGISFNIPLFRCKMKKNRCSFLTFIAYKFNL